MGDGAPPHLNPPPPSPSSFLEGSPSSGATDDDEDNDGEGVIGIDDFALPVGDPLNNAKRILHGVQSLTRVCSSADRRLSIPSSSVQIGDSAMKSDRMEPAVTHDERTHTTSDVHRIT